MTGEVENNDYLMNGYCDCVRQQIHEGGIFSSVDGYEAEKMGRWRNVSWSDKSQTGSIWDLLQQIGQGCCGKDQESTLQQRID